MFETLHSRTEGFQGGKRWGDLVKGFKLMIYLETQLGPQKLTAIRGPP